MNWEDTREILPKPHCFHQDDCPVVIQAHNKQAKTSFEAGKQEGIRTMVEYKSESMMKYHELYCAKEDVSILVVPNAFLKEQGVE